MDSNGWRFFRVFSFARFTVDYDYDEELFEFSAFNHIEFIW